MTEKDKKEYARKRIERDLAGNPNDPRRKRKVNINFPPPSKEDEERMSKLDGYGNPLPGYRWQGKEVVEVDDEVLVNPTRTITEDVDVPVHKMTSKGILIHKNNLLPSKKGYLVNDKGETFEYLKNARNIPKGVYKLKLTTNEQGSKRRPKKSRSSKKTK